MFKNFLSLFFIVFFVAACASTPKDTADSSGSGSSDSVSASGDGLTSVDYTSDSSSDGASIVPGSQEDLIVNIGDRVFFAYDSDELSADAQETLQLQAAWLKQHNKSSVTIEGHCDERGTREYNLALGEKRAQAVKNYLNSLGVSSSSLNTISYGKERPAVIGSNDAAWAQNRRSVTVVY
jgi:peptidoglycan-associated lipoprotein